MGDLVLGVAKTVVEGTLTKVQSVIDEEAKLRQSVQRDLVFITGEFEMMQSFLNVADEERVGNNVVRTWVRQVRDLAYDVEDCIEFVVHLDKKPVWWRRVLPIPPCMPAAALPLDEAVDEIKQLKARVEDVSQRNMRYNLLTDSGSKPVAQTEQPAAIAASATAFDILKEARETARMQRGLGSLTELMTMEDHTSVALRVISVWGTGGDLGKTSLIRMAYDDPKICQNFGCRAWVKLVHPFNPHEFLRSLLVQFYANSCQGQGAIVGVDVLTRMKAAAATEKDLVEEFVKQVNEKRYLVVLEDLSAMVEWDSVRIYLPDRQNGSRVIVSTQQFEIASLCTGHPYRVSELKQFSADHSVCVFFKEVFIKAESTALRLSGMTELAKQILKKCGGLPKVIVAIATYLTDDKNIPDPVKRSTWKHLHDDFIRELETNPRLHSAWAVFTWLNSYFRTRPDSLGIFYLSVFPQEHSIRRRRLVRRWIAEGISRDVGGLTAEGNGESFFSELVNLSIIQTPEIATMYSGTRMASCQVEGFVREYIISRPVEDNFVFALEGHCVIDSQRTWRHLAIGSSWDRDRAVFDNIDFSRLRSLTVFGKWESFFVSGKMKLLRVLDLEDALGVTDDDLEQVAELLPRLKFLSLRRCSTVHRLPGSLGDLRQLQTLDVRYTSILTLPTTIVKLQKLQYLRAGAVPLDDNSAVSEDDVDERSVSSFFKFCPGRRQLCYDRRYGVKVPRGGGGGGIIGRLTALNTLGVIDVDVQGGEAILKELKKLTKLRKLGVSGINPGNNQELWSAISGHGHLESLSVRLAKAGEQVCSDGEFSPPENLESLKLYYGYGCPVSRLPEWIEHLHNPRKLKLWRCRLELVDVHVLSELPKIEILRLCVERSETESGGGELRFDEGFLKLKFLELAGTLTRVEFGSEGNCFLEVLQLGCCEPSSVQISGLQHLSPIYLVQVSIKGSCDDQLKEHIQQQLDSHPNKPVLKVE